MKNHRLIFYIAAMACATVAIWGLAHYTAQFNIEDARQEAFMMKACVDAGGQWIKNWGPQHDCRRLER